MKIPVMLVFSVSLLLSISSLAEDSVDDSAEKRSIEEFASADGQIDLEAIRQSGYQGSLDLKGFEVHIDPKTGQPSVQSALTSVSASDPDDIYWDNSISPSILAVNGTVHALANYRRERACAEGVPATGSVDQRHLSEAAVPGPDPQLHHL